MEHLIDRNFIIINIIFLCISVSAIYSCGNRTKQFIEDSKSLFDSKEKNEDSTKNTGNLKMPMPNKVDFRGSDSSNYFEFIEMWKRFYYALHSNDSLTISNYLAEEICTRGGDDSDTTYCYKKARFSEIFSFYLTNNVSYYDGDSSLYGVFTPNRLTISSDWAGIGSLQFSKDSIGDWKLNFIYSTYTGSNRTKQFIEGDNKLLLSKDSTKNTGNLKIPIPVPISINEVEFRGSDSSNYFEFIEMWKRFYYALHSNDSLTISNYLAEEICTWGGDYSIPTYCYKKARFSEIFSFYLANDGDSSLYGIFTPNRLTIASDWAKLGDIHFEKDSIGDWKLDFIYSTFSKD